MVPEWRCNLFTSDTIIIMSYDDTQKKKKTEIIERQASWVRFTRTVKSNSRLLRLREINNFLFTSKKKTNNNQQLSSYLERAAVPQYLTKAVAWPFNSSQINVWQRFPRNQREHIITLSELRQGN